MWVYIGTSELKNAYIGGVYEYSYDFRSKTTSQITSDGWTVIQWTPSFSSYWVRNSGSDRMVKMVNNVQWLGTKMTTCKKLIVEFTRYTTWEAAFSWTLAHYSWGTTSNGTGIYQDNRLGDIWFSFAWSRIATLSGTVSWTVKFKWEYDLVNKTAEISWNGVSKGTATMTDEAVANVRSNSDYVYVYFWGNPRTSNLWGFSDISITIDF